MRCPGCGAEVENEHIAHYPPEEGAPDAPEPAEPAEGVAPVAPAAEAGAGSDPTPAATKPEKRSGFDFSTTMFGGD